MLLSVKKNTGPYFVYMCWLLFVFTSRHFRSCQMKLTATSFRLNLQRGRGLCNPAPHLGNYPK